MIIWVFPYIVAVLELAAAANYLGQHEWRVAIVWFTAGVTTFAFTRIK